MTTVLIILILATFSEPVFTVDKLPKEIRKNVSGAEQKSRMLDLTKESKKRIKKYRKEGKKNLKKLRKVVVNETNSILEIEKHYDVSLKRTLDYQSFLVTTRLEMQELTTDTEWNNIVNTTANPSEKKLRKTKKSILKEDKLIRKKFNNLREVVEEEVDNSDRKALIIEKITLLEKDVFANIKILRAHSYANNATARGPNATRKELEQLLAEENSVKGDVIASFINLYKSGSTNLSNTEWNAIKRQLKHLKN